jgi:hypothetical protein
MATAKQIAANRNNAKKSTGPKTAEGKTKSSKNALKHGLSTPYGLLPGESEEEYAYHREELLDELYPDSSIEHYLADRIVYLSWALKRAAHFTRVTLHDLLGRTCGNPLPRRRHPDVYIAQMVVRDFANNHVIERLEIYERRIENSLYKTMREYEKQKKQSAQSRRSHPHPSSPAPGHAPNPFYAHTERLANPERSCHAEKLCHAERSEASTELPPLESTVDCDASPRTTPNAENPVLKERTQFPDPETEPNSNDDNDLSHVGEFTASPDQTQFDLSEITSHPFVQQARRVNSKLRHAQTLLNTALAP